MAARSYRSTHERLATRVHLGKSGRSRDAWPADCVGSLLLGWRLLLAVLPHLFRLHFGPVGVVVEARVGRRRVLGDLPVGVDFEEVFVGAKKNVPSSPDA